jgi:hypothetical protein
LQADQLELPEGFEAVVITDLDFKKLMIGQGKFGENDQRPYTLEIKLSFIPSLIQGTTIHDIVNI